MQIRSLLLILQSAVALYASTAVAAGYPRVDDGVHRTLKRQGAVNLIVTMRGDTQTVLDSLPHEASFESRGTMITNMVDKLEAHAKTSQADISKLMTQEASSQLASEVRSLWISNQVFFRDASFALVEKLAAMPSVASIEEELVFPAETVTTLNASTVLDSTPQWGITKIQADQVWAAGNTGQGVVIGTIDSGVRFTHEALRGNFRGEFGWYDPETTSEEPYDAYGHGSHTMGTIVGANGYGVAPGATWMACKGSRLHPDGSKTYSQADLAICAQFMLCPTDPTGTIKDCSKAPRLVSNSWSGEASSTHFIPAVAAWRQAGIIPIFSIGNTGTECASARAPGGYDNVIGVGSTDVTDTLAKSSSKGPSIAGVLKPDISAPGVAVLSASPTSDTEYVLKSGTSMATPHVAGVVALLLAVEPSLTFEQVRQRLYDTADLASLQPVNFTCGGTTNDVFPNNLYGYGRVNALSVVKGMRAPQQ